MNLFHQAKPRIKLGAARDMIQRGQMYYAYFNIILLLVTTYTVREAYIKHYIPWINFFWIVGFLLTAMLFIIIIDWKYIYPSQIAFHSHEAYKHKSPIKRDLDNDRMVNNRRFARLEHNQKKMMKYFGLEYDEVD